MTCDINYRAEVGDTALNLLCPFTFEGTKLLATSTSAVEWYKSHAHISFLSEVIKLNMKESKDQKIFGGFVVFLYYIKGKSWKYKATSKEKAESIKKSWVTSKEKAESIESHQKKKLKV